MSRSDRGERGHEIPHATRLITSTATSAHPSRHTGPASSSSLTDMP